MRRRAQAEDPEGKAVVRLNAMKHGILASAVIKAGEGVEDAQASRLSSRD